jgi:hypothetical protein
MQRSQIFSIVLVLSAVNGLVSPYIAIVRIMSFIWAPTWLPADPALLTYLSALIAATTTLLVSGVPAALAEGAVPGWRGTNMPMWIWAGGALALCLLSLLWLMGAMSAR